MYLHLAEIGIEVAQSNAAYIINEGMNYEVMECLVYMYTHVHVVVILK